VLLQLGKHNGMLAQAILELQSNKKESFFQGI
jgi:hypothetical protein